MAKYKIEAPSLHPVGRPVEVVADSVSFSDGFVKFTRMNGAVVKVVRAEHVLVISLVEDENIQTADYPNATGAWSTSQANQQVTVQQQAAALKGLAVRTY